MKITTLVLLASVLTALGACSESDSPAPANDAINTLDANNYRTTLQTALTQLRGAYFNVFVEAPEIVNRFFQLPLPDATEYFGPDPFPTGSETVNCDSGSVTRAVTSSDAQSLAINANFDFIDCLLEDQLYNGQTVIELNGDTPSRLGGQVGIVTMQFNDMEIKSGDSPGITRSLTGSFKNRSGWGAAFIGYTHEYTTEIYAEVSASANFSISNANYIQQLESDYHPDDNRYYRLSEAGSLVLDGTVEQLQAGYNVIIDPTLLYGSKLDMQNRPVYDDDIESGKITFTLASGASVSITQADTDTALADYEVNDGTRSFSETDEWLFPIDCNDNSALNKRNLCDSRR